MGVSLSWVAVETAKAEAIYAKLGVSETGARGDYYDFRMASLALASKWLLLTAKGCEDSILSAHVLSGLSAGTSAVACAIEEHVMYQSAAFWRDGKEIWKVEHSADHGIMDLRVSGQVPQAFDDLHTHYLDRQAAAGGAEADVDYVAEIPLDLAKSVAGFKHDERDPAIDLTSFRELRQGATGLLGRTRGAWWKSWLRVVPS